MRNGARQAAPGPALLGRWVRAGLLTPDQAARIAAAEHYEAPALQGWPPATPEQPRRRGALVAAEALGYVGAALTAAAGAYVAGMYWSDLSTTGRLAVLGSATALLLAAGAFVHAAPAADGSAVAPGPATRLRGALLLLGAAAWAGFLGVLADDVLDLAADDAWLLVGAGSVALTLPLYVWTRGSLQQLGLFLALVSVAGALGAQAHWDEPTLVGVGGWVVSAGWFALGLTDRLAPSRAVLLTGAVGAVVLGQVSAGAAAAHLLVLSTLVTLFVVAIRRDDLVLLVLGTLATLQAVPEAIAFFLGDRTRIAVPVALLFAGTVLVGVAASLVRRRSAPPPPAPATPDATLRTQHAVRRPRVVHRTSHPR